MNTLIQDLRYAARMMAGSRAFTATAVVALALGIAANTLIFSVVNGVLLRSLPFPDSGRILILFERDLKRDTREAIAGANFLDWQEQSHVFDAMAAYRRGSFNLTGSAGPEMISGVITTSGFFSVLGVNPIVGRVLQPTDENLGSGRAVVISASLWESRFNKTPDVIGQKLLASGESFTVVGVMPPGFEYPDEAELWVPPKQTVPEHVLRPNVSMASSRDSHYLSAIARLKPGVTLTEARADMSAVASRLEEQNPNDNMGRGVGLITLRDHTVGDVQTTLLVLFGAVGFVLLIACADVANLLLARGTTRSKEIAIRTALGASRLRIVRQLLTESVLLATLGGALGLLLAVWGLNPLVRLMPAGIYGASNISIDGLVLVFTAAVSLATGVVFGVVPAFQATKNDLNECLKEGGRAGNAGARRNGARGLLVVSEIALSLVLLIGAGLMIRSFIRLEQVKPGFDTRNVFTTRLSLPPTQYAEGGKRASFFHQVLERLGSIPGVESAGAISRLPLTQGNSGRGLLVEGRPADPSGNNPYADYRVITADYFKAMGVALVKGRGFTEQDGTTASNVVIINRTMAARYWPDEEPLGKRVRNNDDGEPWMEIVGVVDDVKHFGLDTQSHAEIYLPYEKDPWPYMTVVVRSAGDQASIAAAIRSEVWSVDKNLPVPEIKTTEQLLSDSVAGRRFNMLLLSLFGVIALVLAAVGIYGVMSYSVTQRSHELGIRIALGANRADVLRLVVGEGMTLAMIGLGIGLVAALALTRAMRSLLFAIDATDPITFATISLVLGGVALLACYVPARRATKVDPIVALRCE